MRFISLLLLFSLCGTAIAQSPREEYRGVVATGLALRKLATTKRVLVIGAHPDDEDNLLLSYLSLKEGADVAYLSLTRGEGGQNSIGGELGPALGVLRTGELLADRTEDWAEQYFTRAYDFGFSKTSTEAFEHWPHDSILADVVARIRSYRPDIIIAIFTGTPRDGHGHHQASGILAREAFDAAADPNRFPEQIRAGLQPHRTLKLVQATGYRQADPTERFNAGEMDPLIGRSYAQLAAIGRSRHRSQDMGSALPLGSRIASIRVLKSLVAGSDSLLWSGIDTTLALPGYNSLVAAGDLPAIVRLLQSSNEFKAQHELQWAQRALLQSDGVVVDANTDVERILPASTFLLDVTVWNSGRNAITMSDAAPQLPGGWSAQRLDSATNTIAAGALATLRFRITVPADAQLSQPYFLTRPRAGDIYSWSTDAPYAGEPFQLDPVRVKVTIDDRNTTVTETVTATHRVVDPRQGELRRAIYVMPAFALRPDPATSVVTVTSLPAAKGIDVGVEVVSNGKGGTVNVAPSLPNGWTAKPAQVAVRVEGVGAIAVARFTIVPARNTTAAKYQVAFAATDSAGNRFTGQQRIIDYPHIINRVMFEPAVLNVSVLEARIARGLRVGYVVGMDAPVPDVLQQMGITVERLDANALAATDLSRFDAVVIGSRAYEVRPDLIANNARLIDYARSGGNLITMYQEYDFINGKFAPYALTIASPHDRITDENSPVRLLDSSAVAMRSPNRITPQDFMGWVQERSLYMAHTWAPEYKPLLEMNDPNEPPQQGGLLVAPLGKGTYTYTGISFFREIPAGVPGALRLFINLLSMGVKDVAL